MIGRMWHGWTTQENADRYQSVLEQEVLPGIEARARGYRGVYVLRRDVDNEVEFVTLTLWESVDGIRSLVGDDVEAAYVPAEARQVLARFDERSVHYELVLEAG
jgi:heme-degrading monooxygenase HmoA